MEFKGTFTALVTPFRDGKVDLKTLEQLVERQLEAGVEGLVPCGTTGEAPTLSLAEHRTVVSLVSRLAKNRAIVLAGAGSNATDKTLELVRINEDCGATALLVVAPYYNRPSQEGLYRHFSAVAQGTKLTIVLYNIPGRCGVEIDVETIRRLYEAHDNIVAVKDATGNVLKGADLMAACDITVLSGDDPMTLPLMSIGARGVVSVVSNLVPRKVKGLVDAVLEHDCDAIHAAHRELYPLARTLLTLDTNPVPVKTAMAIRGLCTEEFRLPLCPLPEEKRQRLVGLVERLEI